MDRLKLSNQAKQIADSLIDLKDSEKTGYIAAIEPNTGEVFYGNTVVEAAKEGRRGKNNPKAVFFFVRVGYPSVHVLKSVVLQGRIENNYFPTIKGYVHNRNLYLDSAFPENTELIDFIADTGFSGYIVLDPEILKSINRDYLGEDSVTLAGGINFPVGVYIGDITVNTIRLKEVEITEISNEYLLGMALMKAISKRVMFVFDTDEIIFEG